MSVPADSVLEARVERLLSSLAGVVSVRAIAGADGRLEEIHVLSTPELHPKQVVRNVESALSAGLGLEVDRRIVSVAQVREAALGESLQAEAPAPAASGEPEPRERLVLVRYDTRTQGAHEAQCRVVLRQGEAEYTGSGEGANTPQGRAGAAARALFAALSASRGREDLALEDATLVDTLGRTFVLVAAHGLAGRQSVPLTGVAAVARSAEEAAILASLQATNRWAELLS
jgi:hypothetical protein